MYTFDERLVSDLHKDAYGYRPGEWFWEDWTGSSDSRKQEIWDGLLVALDHTIAEEARETQIRVGDFERGVRQNLAFGATCREDAIRWMLDPVLTDSDLMYGGEYACFAFGLPWAPYKMELDPIVAKIQQARMQKELDSTAA